MPRGQPMEVEMPVGGLRYDLPLHKVPAGAAFDGENWMAKFGVLQSRPGLTALFATGFGESVMGGLYYTLNAQTARMVAGGLTKWQRADFGAAAWVDITGVALTGTLDNQIRFIAWPEGGNTYAIGVNNVDGPKEWDGAAATYVALTGLSQWTTAKDLTICANRICIGNSVEGGIRYPFRTRFSNFNTRSTWSAVDFSDLQEGNDAIVAVRALNRTSYAILGEQTQWIGSAQTGTFPFRYELQDRQPGPLSPGAVIARQNLLYYMGNDGSFYHFDGVRTTHIGEPIRKRVQTNLNYATANRSHGVYRSIDRRVWWYFPTTTNNPTEAASYDVDTGKWEYHQFPTTFDLMSSWPYTIQASLSWDTLPVGWTWDTIDTTTYPSWDSFPGTGSPEELIGSASQVYRFHDIGNDAGDNITARWEQLVGPLPPGVRGRVDAVETFFKKLSTAATATVSVGSTDTLGTMPQYPAALVGTFDVSVDTRHELDLATAATGEGSGTAEAQFMFLKQAITAAMPWEFRGAHVYGMPQRVQ